MKPSRLTLFADVKQIADQALASGGGSYTLSTHGEAIHWRQRFYAFRKAYAKEHGHSPYDVFNLRRIAADSCTVVMDLRRPAGIFTPSVPPQSEFDKLAEELREKYGDEL